MTVVVKEGQMCHFVLLFVVAVTLLCITVKVKLVQSVLDGGIEKYRRKI